MSGRKGKRIEADDAALERRRLVPVQEKMAEARKRRQKSLADRPEAANLTRAVRQMRDPDADAPIGPTKPARALLGWSAAAACLGVVFAAAWNERPIAEQSDGGVSTAPALGLSSGPEIGSVEAPDGNTPRLDLTRRDEPVTGPVPRLAAAPDRRAGPVPATAPPSRPAIAAVPRLAESGTSGTPPRISVATGPVRQPSPTAPAPASAGWRPEFSPDGGTRVATPRLDFMAAPPMRPEVVHQWSDQSPLPGPVVPAVFHVPVRTAPDTVRAVREAAAWAGFDLGEAHRQSLTIRNSNVRYFHEADRELAARLADATGADLRDFTGFRPSPPVGTLEFWAAGRAPQAARRPSEQTGFFAGLRRDLGSMGRELGGLIRSIGN